MSNSQFHQDLIALHDVYDFKENGFFVDIGAYDGLYLSNTSLMEEKFGWTGICVEPVPFLYKEAKRNRKCVVVNKACGLGPSIEVPKVFFYTPANKRINLNTYDIVCTLTSNEVVQMECNTLQQILDDNHAPSFIEYLTIDTDGFDYDIISSVDFDKYVFGVINIEHNGKDKEIRELLESKGYKHLYCIGFDDIYIHKSIKLKIDSLLNF